MSKKLEIQKIFPLTSMQEGMFFEHLYNKDASAYFEQMRFTVRGKLDVGKCEESFNLLIEKYDLLRSIFAYKNLEKPARVVLKQVRAKLKYEDITNMPADGRADYVDNYAQQDIDKGFNLEKEIPTRLSILKKADDEYVVIWSTHHIVLDGWSNGIVLNDFFEFYGLLVHGQPVPKVPIAQFDQYLKWIGDQDREEGLAYWQKYLGGYAEQATMPRQYANAGEDFELKIAKHVVDDALYQKAKQFANENQVTINNLFQCAWGILLQKYNNTEDVVFGNVVSGRNPQITDIEEMVGLFINTIPVRVATGEGKTLIALVKEISQATLDAQQYDYLPLYEIQNQSELNNELVDNILVFENYPLSEEVGKMDLTSTLGLGLEDARLFTQTNYNFDVTVVPGDDLVVEVFYNSLVYDNAVAGRVPEQLAQVLAKIVEAPQTLVQDIGIVSSEEAALQDSFNQSQADFDTHHTFHQLFEAQAANNPSQIAVAYGDGQGEELDYHTLNNRANQLATELREQGLQPDDIVGIYAKRTTSTIVAVLAVLKAGGAYLPLDPAYPQDRIAYMIESSGTNTIIANEPLPEGISFGGNLMHLADREWASEETPNLPNTVEPKHLAYVIFTSGSTGRPKGVMISHANYVNNTFAWRKDFGLGQFSPNLLQMAGFSFDVFCADLGRALLNGGKLVLCPDDLKLDWQALYGLIDQHQISLFEATPALVIPFLEYVYDQQLPLEVLHTADVGADTDEF